jgi:hypothetical protein
MREACGMIVSTENRVLDDAAGECGEAKQQYRDAESAEDRHGEVPHQRRETRTVGGNLPGMGEEAAERRLQACGHRRRKHHEHEGAAADHEPGVDLCALDDVAALDRFLEPFRRRVFCPFGIVAFVGHRACSPVRRERAEHATGIVEEQSHHRAEHQH